MTASLLAICDHFPQQPLTNALSLFGRVDGDPVQERETASAKDPTVSRSDNLAIHLRNKKVVLPIFRIKGLQIILPANTAHVKHVCLSRVVSPFESIEYVQCSLSHNSHCFIDIGPLHLSDPTSHVITWEHAPALSFVGFGA